MSSPPAVSQQTGSPPADLEQIDSPQPQPQPLAIQDIANKISELIEKFSETLHPEAKNKAVTRQQATAAAGTNGATSNNETGENVDEKEEGGASKQNNHVQSGKEDKKKKFMLELEKLHKELQYIGSLFEKLTTFSSNLREPLTTLEKNVKDILDDLRLVTESNLPKQVENNLRVAKSNITRVKIQIPLQHASSEANRPWQKTVATNEAYDLPQLYDNEEIFEKSYYFQEIEDKFKRLDDRHKLCLLCFAIFPENAEIKKRLLRFWWVGENLLEKEEDEKKSVDDTLEVFVKEGFIEPIQKRNKLPPRSYQMNPIVRPCLIKFANYKDTRFFDYDQEGKPTMNFSSCKKACMVKLSEEATAPWFSRYLDIPAPADPKEDPKKKAQKKQEPGKKDQKKEDSKEEDPEKKDAKEEMPQEEDTARLPADLVKLQMLFNFPTREILTDASKRFNELQTLFNISRQFPALPKEWFYKMTDIKVLYLGGWESKPGSQRHIEVEDIDFLRGFKKMNKLRLLSLQGISGIPRLPSSVCKLSSLRILNLRACHNLEKLPDRIGSLKQLAYMDLSECYLLDHMPKELRELSELEVLKGFVIGIGNVKNSCTLEDLAKLKKLRKLSVNVHNEGFDIDREEKALSEFKSLEKLRIAWGSGSSESSPTATESKNQEKEENNKRQDASKSVGRKPDNKQGAGEPKPNGLENLVKLDLQCFPEKAPPTWLVPSKVKKLKNLSLRGGRLVKLNDNEGEWKNVTFLHLKYLTDFKMNWKEMRAQFPTLTYLENVRCPRVTFCPCDANGVWQKPSEQ